MGTINSKRKGKVAEIEVVHILTDHGFEARRTAQYCGNTGDAADVISDLPYHIEVKHQETLQIDKWWEQATHDAKESGKEPILVFRKNNQRWRVVMDFENFLKLNEKVLGKTEKCVNLELTKKGDNNGIND